MIDLTETLATAMDRSPLSRTAWHNATEQQRLHAARVVASNFGDDGEWTQRRADEVCQTVVGDVTVLLGRLR